MSLSTAPKFRYGRLGPFRGTVIALLVAAVLACSGAAYLLDPGPAHSYNIPPCRAVDPDIQHEMTLATGEVNSIMAKSDDWNGQLTTAEQTLGNLRSTGHVREADYPDLAGTLATLRQNYANNHVLVQEMENSLAVLKARYEQLQDGGVAPDEAAFRSAMYYFDELNSDWTGNSHGYSAFSRGSVGLMNWYNGKLVPAVGNTGYRLEPITSLPLPDPPADDPGPER
jgi:hypothetical protein